MPRAARTMVFCYDISADGVRSRVAKRLEKVAVRVQKSVFETRMTAERAHRLGAELATLIGDGDSLRVYAIDAGDLRASRAWARRPCRPRPIAGSYNRHVRDTTGMANPIDERLSAPPRQQRIDELPRQWRHCEIAVTCTPLPVRAARLDLLNKVRGAFGDQLLAGASPAARRRMPCDWDPPCALDVLFRRRSIAGLNAGAPSPFVLSVDEGAARGLTVRLTVLGFAECCAAEAAEALVRGLRAGLLLDGSFVKVEAYHRRIRPVPHVVRPEDLGRTVSLVFDTPVVSRAEGEPAISANAILRGTFQRIAGLARWYGVEVATPLQWVDECLARLRVDNFGLRSADPRFRLSQRAPQRGYFIEPLAGTLRLSGDWLSLWPLLAIGEVIHAGGRTTDGDGRFRLVAG